MPCSGLYSMLHRYLDFKKLEEKFKRRLRRVLRKYL
jgi:hypothetical protein